MAELDLTAAIEAAADALNDEIGRQDIGTSASGLAAIAVRAAAPFIERAVRERAAIEIGLHAQQHAPIDGNEAQRRLRRHLLIAARVVEPRISFVEAAEELTAAIARLAEGTDG